MTAMQKFPIKLKKKKKKRKTEKKNLNGDLTA